MADGFERPTLSDLVARIWTDLSTSVDDAAVSLRRTYYSVLARVQAGAVHGLYGFIDYLAGQLLPDRATGLWLARWAGVWRITRKPATAATGTVVLAAVSGAVVPAGTLFQRPGGGDYRAVSAALESSSRVSVVVQAVDVGSAGNAVAGLALSLVSPVPGVAASGVASVLSGGADVETDDDLRARLMARIQRPPHGGAEYDYQGWALATPGVTIPPGRVWARGGWMGPGTVGVTFLVSGADSYIPTAQQVSLVQAYIDARRPVTAHAIVYAAAPLTVPLSLRLVTDTPAIRAAVTEELRDLFARVSSPMGMTLYRSNLSEAVSLATGETAHVLSQPVTDVSVPVGQVPVLGLITWL